MIAALQILRKDYSHHLRGSFVQALSNLNLNSPVVKANELNKIPHLLDS
jgi:hypothetical protein